MKKYFFIVGLAAFSFAAAQENNHFDIQKFLQKKQAEQKPIGRLFLDKFQKPIPIYLSQDPPQAKLMQVLPNGNKVFSLPQDNMPCIVPDMDQYVDNMPPSPKKIDLFNKQQNYRQQPGAIPNPAYPWKIIPNDSNK